MSTKQLSTDRLLAQMPSLRALKCFVTAARHESFTKAAEILCVTQAAISRQIKELEDVLEVELFDRTGRTIKLTEAGRILYNASYLSIMNIASAADVVRRSQHQSLNLCVSYSFSALWLSPRLASFRKAFPSIKLNITVTDNFMALEGLVQPDVIITKNPPVTAAQYEVENLFHDIVYPVCSPSFNENNIQGGIKRPLDIFNYPTLHLSIIGRDQVCEHVDWRVWRNWFQNTSDAGRFKPEEPFESNDYRLLISMAEAGEGIVLGWHHLVHRQIEKGSLVRPVDAVLEFKDRHHYLVTNKNSKVREDFQNFKSWLTAEVGEMMVDWPNDEA
ncbi:LysR family transcriptional regulator [Leeia sp. TBRC 13508]|uniref:LysR family transcriptional regulator n=1 Tax=Leeia speluncae TaxID=2884804 RepID=A0ABS8D1N6_9NEIS|nr:LysR substrate-binding domain-containing protein [Leeia speluncae]MCB6182097.1 LysR family transcriptional regulator [Leeia speluncae]